jgi:hypothetical protein
MTDPKKTDAGTPEADSLQSYTDEVKQREEGVKGAKEDAKPKPGIPEYPPNINPATKTPPPGG